jgi:hypothetical protein
MLSHPSARTCDCVLHITFVVVSICAIASGAAVGHFAPKSRVLRPPGNRFGLQVGTALSKPLHIATKCHPIVMDSLASAYLAPVDAAELPR